MGICKQNVAEQKKGNSFNEESFVIKIVQCAGLIAEEKQLKKQIKEETESLQLKTKETIENLDDD